MSKDRFSWWPGLAVAILAAGCGSEGPVGVGSGLVPIEVETFEVVLPVSVFLEDARDFSGYVTAVNARSTVAAAGFGGMLDARSLARFPRLPDVVNYVDPDGVARSDDSPSFVGGSLVVLVDTLRSWADGPVQLSLYRVGEAWDPQTAGWTFRVDSTNQRVPWTEEGGTLGELVSREVWVPDVDSVMLAVDSQTVALWGDTANASRGAMVVVETEGARIFLTRWLLRLDARPSGHPDTLATVTLAASVTTSLSNPSPPDQPEMQVGGVPSWRSFIRLAERLDTVTVCADGQRCFPLSATTLNYAALILRPAPVPAGFVPEDTIRIEARAVLSHDGVPLQRSPLAERLTPFERPNVPLAPDRFFEGGAGDPVELPMTSFVAALARARTPEQLTRNQLALIAAPEGALHGYGAFLAAGDGAPRLRLIVSTAPEGAVQ